MNLAKFFLLLAASVSFCCCPGCGGPTSTQVDAPSISVAEMIRNDLKMTAENGQLGSEMSSIMDNLATYREENPGLASELQGDLEKLETLSGAQATAKANEMIAKIQ